jgi:hypothetical protein
MSATHSTTKTVGKIAVFSARLVPHLFVLSAGLDLWPLLLAPFVSGWLYGWLLYRSGSILPGWLGHSLAIALAAAGVMS